MADPGQRRRLLFASLHAPTFLPSLPKLAWTVPETNSVPARCLVAAAAARRWLWVPQFRLFACAACSSHRTHFAVDQYRLCKADQPLTEACFFKTPLPFNESGQAIQFNNGTRLPIKGTFLRNGTLPLGSTWAMNPIPPRCLGACTYNRYCAHLKGR